MEVHRERHATTNTEGEYAHGELRDPQQLPEPAAGPAAAGRRGLAPAHGGLDRSAGLIS